MRFCLLTKDYCLDKYEKDRMENDWEMADHAHLHLIWPGDLELWPLTLKLLSRRHLVNFYLHAKFERDRIKNDRVIESESRWEKNNNNTQKTEQKQKGLRLRRQTLINIRYKFWTERDRDFIFGMHTRLMMPFQMTRGVMTLWPWLWPLH